MTNYPTKKLGEVASIKTGKLDANAANADGTYPFYTCSRDISRINETAFDGESVLIAGNGEFWVKYHEGGKFNAYQRTYVIQAHDEVLTKYLFFNLTIEVPKLISQGGVIQYLRLPQLKNLQIPLPPVGEQRKIVAKLEKVLGKIKEAKKLREEAESAAAALLPAELHSIFTKPTTPQNKHPYKLENVRMSPKWEEKELGNLFDITSSKRVFKSEWTTSGVPFFRAREIVSMAKGRAFRSPIYISEELYKKYKEKYGVPKSGDILATGVGTLVIKYCVKDNDKFYFKDGNIIWFKNKSTVNSEFINYFFKSDFLRNQVDANAGGATVRTFTIKTANKIKIPLPPIAKQKKIVARLDALSAKITALHQAQSQTASDFTALEQSVLHQAFTNPT